MNQYMNKPHWCIYYWIKSINKSHKLGRAHGWILYCGLIMPLLVAFRLILWYWTWSGWIWWVCRSHLWPSWFFCARLWSFVPSSFPWALKILLHIIKSWNFQDLIRLCSGESSECFLHCLINILYIFQKKWSMIKRLKLLKPFFLDQLPSLDHTKVEQIMFKKCISS